MPVDNALHIACKHGNLAEVQAQVGHFDINSLGEFDTTPLYWAAKEGHADVVEFLLGKSPDVNIPNSSGTTPLMRASRDGRTAVIKLLLAVPGINVNFASESQGFTALLQAANNGHTAVVEALTNHPDIKINQANHDGKKPIDVASNEAIKVLLRNAMLAQDGDESIRDHHVTPGQPKEPVFGLTAREDEAAKKQREAMTILQQHGPVQAALQSEEDKPPSVLTEELKHAATSNFIGLTSTQVADLVMSFGEQYTFNQYVEYRDNIIQNDLTGAVVAQSLDDNDLGDILKEVGITSKLVLKAIEVKFRSYYHPKSHHKSKSSNAETSAAGTGVAAVRVQGKTTSSEPEVVSHEHDVVATPANGVMVGVGGGGGDIKTKLLDLIDTSIASGTVPVDKLGLLAAIRSMAAQL